MSIVCERCGKEVNDDAEILEEGDYAGVPLCPDCWAAGCWSREDEKSEGENET